mgnify:CR=1 FL=1
MTEKRRLRDALKDPSVPVLIVVGVLALLFVAGAVAMAVLGYDGVWAYVVYAGAAVFFAYAVYLLIRFIPRIKGAFARAAEKSPALRRVLHDYGARTVVFASFAFAVNIGYAVFQGVMGILAHSVWFGVLACYYILLSALRGGILLGEHRLRRRGGEQIEGKLKLYRLCGISLMVLDLAMCAAVTQMVLYGSPVQNGAIQVIVSAAYTFYKAILAVVNFVKAKRLRDPVVQSLRGICAVDALISVVALETAMLATFGNGEDMLALRAATGFAACAIAIAIGITMTVFACRRLKAAKASPAAEGAAEGADGAQRSAEALPAPEAVLFAQREEPAPQREEERRDE